jgi:hypothetical protein
MVNNRKINRIGFISTRIAGTDGVSLEIAKWAQVLERNGFGCFYFAGELDRDPAHSFLFPEAHFEHPEIEALCTIMLGKWNRPPEISEKIQKLKKRLKAAIAEFIHQFKIDLIIPENALAIPMNIPLGLALTELVAETGIPTIAHHHDFYWERDRFLVNPCQDYLDMAFPPDHHSIRHVVINSIASKQLSHRVGISNTIIPNVYDFYNEPEVPPKKDKDLRQKIGLGDNDLFVLQPTRIVPRKWLERSIEIIHYLRLDNPKLIISHSSGDEGDDYFYRIMEYAKHLGVEIVAIGHLVGGTGKNKKEYTIADIYKCADLITYPSGYEGFGNAFLETIYYRKPIIVNRYSIYIADIEPKAFDVIAIHGFVTEKAIARVHHLMKDPIAMKEMVNKNYELGRRYFSYEILEKKLLHLIQTFE